MIVGDNPGAFISDMERVCAALPLRFCQTNNNGVYL